MEGLTSELFCPTFDGLPVHREVSEDLYNFRFDGFPSPKRHWMFVAQVVDCSCSKDKKQDHKTLVADRVMMKEGRSVALKFFYDKDAPCTFRWSDIKDGNTLVIMYAEKDAAGGFVRVDSLDYCKVVAMGLNQLLDNPDGNEVKELIKHASPWEHWDKFRPFPIDKLPVASDMFGKGDLQ